MSKLTTNGDFVCPLNFENPLDVENISDEIEDKSTIPQDIIPQNIITEDVDEDNQNTKLICVVENSLENQDLNEEFLCPVDCEEYRNYLVTKSNYDESQYPLNDKEVLIINYVCFPIKIVLCIPCLFGLFANSCFNSCLQTHKNYLC